MNKYLVLISTVLMGGIANGSDANLYNCSHTNLPNSMQACDAIVASNDYNAMVNLCSSGLVYAGQQGPVDFCGQLSNAPAASLAKAIDANSNGQGVQLEYICMHPSAHGMTSQVSQIACDLLSDGVENGSYNAAVSAVGICTSGFNNSFCNLLSRQGRNPVVARAIGANVGVGHGVQLDNVCLHANLPNSNQACALLQQGAANDVNAASGAVLVCASGLNDAMCKSLSRLGKTSALVSAVNRYANDALINLQYRCSHANEAGSKQSCSLLNLAKKSPVLTNLKVSPKAKASVRPLAPVVKKMVKPAVKQVKPVVNNVLTPAQIQNLANGCTNSATATTPSCVAFANLLKAGNQTAIQMGQQPCSVGPLMYDVCHAVWA